MQYNGFAKQTERGFIMKSKEKHCQSCGAEIVDKKAKICSACGAKIRKPIFKKWWFWVIVILGVAIIGGAFGSDTDGGSNAGESDIDGASSSNGGAASAEKYEVVDLQQLLDELEGNALKAEKTYQNKYVQMTGKIDNIDSDGSYITIEPVNADEWNFDTVMCYIKKDSQRDFLMEKSVGDTVTIKGKIISIGEVLGYSVNIDEIN